MKSHFSRLGLFLLWGVCFSACSRVELPAPTPRVEIVRVEITATPRSTLTPTLTPTQTLTPTPTPTRTPTALPVVISGDPLAALIAEPVSQSGAICGFVDYFDFPIDPPNAEFGRGGGDYGVYRQRYQSNHAGEDWGVQTGENFGTPVYVIGHGMVTYSQPYGWGLDQGTVIVQHTYRNGRIIYSFYGHLDPPSVVLRPGTCLTRGDTVGNIGDPSGRPHLHFEIRLHNPDTPGPGYWSVDPTLAGWFPPSRTIWENRMVQQPGTVWARFPAEGSFYVGATEEMIFTVEEGELRALNIADGRVIWRHELETNFPTVLLSIEAGLVYLADPLGHLAAFSLPTPDMMAEWNNTKVVLELAWERELDVLGSPLLLPLADGAVAIALKQTTLAFSSAGEELWEADGLSTISEWLLVGERLIISATGNAPALWVATIAGLELLSDESGGQLAFSGNEIYVYQPDGMYRTNSETGGYVNLYTFSDAVQFDRNMMALPEGGVMISHADLSDRRLLAFDPTGRLMWERSVESLGTIQGFAAVRGEVYALFQETQSSAAILYLYRVNLRDGTLTEIFRGGTRTADRGETWIKTLPSGGILIQIGGGHMILFAP